MNYALVTNETQDLNISALTQDEYWKGGLVVAENKNESGFYRRAQQFTSRRH